MLEYKKFRGYFMKKSTLLFCFILQSFILFGLEQKQFSPSIYDVIWDSPSKSASGQMPIGNGDIGAGVYAIENGDLFLLLSKNDALSYSGDLFKTGRVKISIRPNPFISGTPFIQRLDLESGAILIKAGELSLRIWADANNPLIHIEIDSSKVVTVSVKADLWERIDHCAYNCTSKPVENPTQDIRADRDGALIWYYNVGDRSVFKSDMNYYGVPDMITDFVDPYKNRVFGNLVKSNQLRYDKGALFGSNSKFDIQIYSLTSKEGNPKKWIKKIELLSNQTYSIKESWKAHCSYWRKFWKRSWVRLSSNNIELDKREKFSGEALNGRRVEVDGGALVAQSYNVFRFLMACQGKGAVPVKFNGGIFTMPLEYPNQTKSRDIKTENGWRLHEDERDWGRRFTFQNQRLLYWPLLMSGDYEIMRPFFDYYKGVLPVRKAITESWFGHKGAYFRENIEATGAEKDNGKDGRPPRIPAGENRGQGYYHSFYFTSGLEIVTMMIDYYNFTSDLDFRDNTLIPFAREVLLFFDNHYKRDKKGKLVIDPAQVLETWWIAINPAPDIAGLKHNLTTLVDEGIGTKEDLTNWKRFLSEIPPLRLKGTKKTRWIAPAYKYKKKMNAENGLLYPVFPFRLYGKALGSETIVSNTMKHRSTVDAFDHKCWSQDQIDWAYAGDANEARDGLISRFRHASKACRFPLYGSAGPDSCPDFDHFGSGSIALQRMLIQEADGKIFLLPAWPTDWNVNFKLHLEHGTNIKAIIKDGKLIDWSIFPTERKKDVVICGSWGE